MTTLLPQIDYPSRDGRPVAESYLHMYAMFLTLEVLRQYLEGKQATVLSNQFLYYSEGIPTARVAPDVMVIFGVEPGGRDNYKIWVEGQVPSVVFEITSPSTRNQDQGIKKVLYEQLGVSEYWLFDPKGEWIDEKLLGYRLTPTLAPEDLPQAIYAPILDSTSTVLGLRLSVEESLIAFYRLDNGQKLLIPSELISRLRDAEQRIEQAEQAAGQAEQAATQERRRAEALASRLRELGFDPEP